MSEIAKIIGQRIRNYRVRLNWSQEKLAELSGRHSTYIGQLERGEKNATVEVVSQIAAALNVPLSSLFEKLGEGSDDKDNIPLKCYELVAAKSYAEQKQILKILSEIEKYGTL